MLCTSRYELQSFVIDYKKTKSHIENIKFEMIYKEAHLDIFKTNEMVLLVFRSDSWFAYNNGKCTLNDKCDNYFKKWLKKAQLDIFKTIAIALLIFRLES